MKLIKTRLKSLFSLPRMTFAITGFPSIEPLATGPTFQTFALRIANWIIWLAGGLALLYLVYGGIVYITAAGNEDKAKTGKNAVLQAVIGIAIILFARVIISWINAIITAGP